MISDAHIEERREKLEKWLQGVLNTPINRDYHETVYTKCSISAIPKIFYKILIFRPNFLKSLGIRSLTNLVENTKRVE
jgi:hypothetical protein